MSLRLLFGLFQAAVAIMLASSFKRLSSVQYRSACSKSATIARKSMPTKLFSSQATENKSTSLMQSIDLSAIDLPTNDNSPNLLRIRHTSAHVLAMAVQRLFPLVRVTIGPWIDNGFYYDFFVPEGQQLSVEDLKKIKKEMDRIIRSNFPLRREEVSRDEALSRIRLLNETFKEEILTNLKEPITLYHIGEKWWDLCAGPHVESTGKLDSSAIELQSVAGAYWRGDESRPMLQRIYGTAWENKEQLDLYNFRQEEARRRDHRTIGKAMDLFSIQEDAGGGLVFWHAKGGIIRRLIEDYWKEMHVQNGYKILFTPHIANINLWKTSGHFDFYRNDMFKAMEVDEEEYQLKPMNCPFHCLLFKDTPKSYRDLPTRMAELGTVYRYEKSGSLHGLFRVRGFTQDDAHIFCLPEQLEDEIVGVLNLVETVLSKFGFNSYEIMLSTRPPESVGSDEIWSKATAALIQALNRKGWAYQVDEGGGAFYGPKIDIKIRDAIGRKWQCSTVQCDFNLPDRFDLEYIASDQSRLRPIMVHRAIFGSIERFFGVLIESTAGEFPFWLAPVQLKLLPVVDGAYDYCKEIERQAMALGIRVEIDTSGNRIAKQVRDAEQAKIPAVAIIGMNEVAGRNVSLRIRKIGDIGSFELPVALNTLASVSTNSGVLEKASFPDTSTN